MYIYNEEKLFLNRFGNKRVTEAGGGQDLFLSVPVRGSIVKG